VLCAAFSAGFVDAIVVTLIAKTGADAWTLHH
jgi:hypothetical protein